MNNNNKKKRHVWSLDWKWSVLQTYVIRQSFVTLRRLRAQKIAGLVFLIESPDKRLASRTVNTWDQKPGCKGRAFDLWGRRRVREDVYGLVLLFALTKSKASTLVLAILSWIIESWDFTWTQIPHPYKNLIVAPLVLFDKCWGKSARYPRPNMGRFLEVTGV